MRFLRTHLTSLTQRFMLGIIPVSLAGMMALGVSAFYVVRHHIVKSIDKEVEALSQGAALSISNYFRQRENDLSTLSETPLLADYYNNADYGLHEEAEQYRQEIGHNFLKFYNRTGAYTRIIYADEKGMEVCRVEKGKVSGARKLFPDRKLYDRVAGIRGRNYFRSDVSLDPEYGHNMVYGKPLFNGGLFRGVILLEASLEPVQNTLDYLRVGHSGRAYISDSSGTQLLGTPVPPAKADTAGRNLTATAPIEGTDFNVVVLAKMRDFQGPLNAISNFTILLGIVVSSVVAFLIYVMIRSMTSPIKKLAEVTKRLANGKLDERVEIKSTDEIENLAESFNIMAVNLQQRTEDLESRIKELLFLQNMSVAVVQNLETENICKSCLEAAVGGLGFERGVFYAVNHEWRQITGQYVHSTQDSGFTEKQMHSRRISMESDDILAHVVRDKKPVNVKNPAEDPRCNPRFVQEVSTKAFCLVPIMTQHKIFGVIGVDNYYSGRPVTDDQMSNLVLFCNFTGLALENAELVADIRRSEARYRTVLDSSMDAIIGLDAAMRVTVWNRGAGQMFGYQSGEITGQSVSRLFEPLVFENILKAVIQEGFFSSHGVQGISRSGRKLELDVAWTTAGRQDCPGREWALVIRDLTEHKKLQSQLIQAEKLSAVGQLISGVAHELNNPLTVIAGYSELLHKESCCSSKQPSEEILQIYESSGRCREIINNLLAFVRESRNRRQAVNIPEVIKSALSLMEYKLRKTEDIKITQKVDPNLPPVLGDSQQIEQVLVNLIQNACDALSQKKGDRSIAIKTHYKGAMVYVAVSDNGPGIPPEIQSQVFEPFFTTKEEGQGTGLGLPICQRILKEHGGSLRLSSQPGEGTTFTVELPLVSQIPQEDKAPLAAPVRLAPGRKVLVADDEEDILLLIKKILEAEDQTVDVASSGREALEKIKTGRYDLLICDMELSGIDGAAIKDEIKAGGFPTKVIFTTGNLLNQKLMKKLQSSGSPYLAKPFDISELIRTVKDILS